VDSKFAQEINVFYVALRPSDSQSKAAQSASKIFKASASIMEPVRPKALMSIKETRNWTYRRSGIGKRKNV
jgi:hypothetical protein